jgi:stage IV sporulation protein FB
MGWESRNYGRAYGEGGNFRRVLRRVFGDGENPLGWSLPLYTAFGIRVRMHLLFILMIAFELIGAIRSDRLGPGYIALAMGALWLTVLLHEYGHCIACRLVGGTADQILMWPLGGLAYCMPPYTWKAHLITTLGGPAVNALLLPVIGGVLLLLGQGWDTIVFNPFDPGFAMLNLHWNATLPYWLIAIWWMYYTNALLLAFNMLLPMYPMDGAQAVHAILWSRTSDRTATRIVCRVGLFVAIALFFFAMATGAGRLMGLALFGGLMSWMQLRQLAMTEGEQVAGGYDFSRGYQGLPRETGGAEVGPSKAELRRREKERKLAEDDQAELDRLLAKIASGGMDSLTGSERKWLQRESERKRAEAER